MSMRFRGLRESRCPSGAEHAGVARRTRTCRVVRGGLRCAPAELVVDEGLQTGFERGDLVDGPADVHVARTLRVGERPQVALAVDPFPGRFPIPVGGPLVRRHCWRNRSRLDRCALFTSRACAWGAGRGGVGDRHRLRTRQFPGPQRVFHHRQRRQLLRHAQYVVGPPSLTRPSPPSTRPRTLPPPASTPGTSSTRRASRSFMAAAMTLPMRSVAVCSYIGTTEGRVERCRDRTWSPAVACHHVAISVGWLEHMFDCNCLSRGAQTKDRKFAAILRARAPGVRVPRPQRCSDPRGRAQRLIQNRKPKRYVQERSSRRSRT